MKRILLLTFLACLLSSCYYNTKTKCYYDIVNVYCVRHYKSNFDAYQKEGITEEQKITDMKACLGERAEGIDVKNISIFYQLRKKYPQVDAVQELDYCLKHKGYIYDDLIRD